MKASTNSTLAATLIATGAGTGVWISGLSATIWPAHPQLAVLAVTIVTGMVVKQVWPAGDGGKRA
jgi:hypothetical protein